VTSRSPRGLALVATVAALAAVAPFALAPDAAAPSQTGPGAQLLDEARQAAQEQDYSGVLEVSWSDAKGEHDSDVSVRSANGVLALGDRPQVIVEGARRFVQGPDGWLAVWSQEAKPNVPPASDKWQLDVRDGPTVAGRPTREIDATDRRDGRVRERLYLDETTSLLLRREQIDTRGRTVRAVGFTTIGEPAVGAFIGTLQGEAPQTPSRSTNRQPRVLDEVASPFRAPRSTGDGFRLAGRYDEDSHTLHLFYSDGLYGVSVFEQKGELDATGLPAGGESRTVAGRDVRQYQTPGGAVLVWEAGDVVYTTVSDAPVDQLDDVLADVTPPAHDSPLDRVTNFVLGPFSW
jgi:sigma-E factor negative regulatory protein RseB